MTFRVGQRRQAQMVKVFLGFSDFIATHDQVMDQIGTAKFKIIVKHGQLWGEQIFGLLHLPDNGLQFM